MVICMVNAFTLATQSPEVLCASDGTLGTFYFLLFINFLKQILLGQLFFFLILSTSSEIESLKILLIIATIAKHLIVVNTNLKVLLDLLIFTIKIDYNYKFQGIDDGDRSFGHEEEQAFTKLLVTVTTENEGDEKLFGQNYVIIKIWLIFVLPSANHSPIQTLVMLVKLAYIIGVVGFNAINFFPIQFDEVVMRSHILILLSFFKFSKTYLVLHLNGFFWCFLFIYAFKMDVPHIKIITTLYITSDKKESYVRVLTIGTSWGFFHGKGDVSGNLIITSRAQC
ncbi:hypothetical protein ACJX0J_040706, partial [Zea mays]